MNPYKILTSTLVLLFLTVIPLHAQPADNNFKNQFERHFNYASRVVQLAEAVPADQYDWRPAEGVMSVEEVYTHIARYNYLYLVNNLGATLPRGVDLENMESITGKENVVKVLEQSTEFVQKVVEEMPDATLSESTELYGQTVNGQAVLMQLITHLSEHVGQSIAYARSNGVVPPWSE